MVVLFDIDGTLVRTGGAGRRALLQSVRDVYGHEGRFDFSFGGMTDMGIFRRGLQGAPVAGSDASVQAVLERYLKLLAADLGDPADVEVLPGALDLVRFALTLPRVAVGLGTGNVERGARLKLRGHGFNELLLFGGFGCDHELRPELISAGHRRGMAQLGVQEAGLVIVGDTEHDVTASAANGGLTLAVTTGTRSAEALKGAEVVLSTLVGAEAALERLINAARP